MHVRDEKTRDEGGHKKSRTQEFVECMISSFILAVIVLTFVGRAFKIPSSSMYPTLQNGDRIFVSRFAYRFAAPKRSDIAVFIYPEDKKRDFVKRIVGLPGETVEIRDGHVWINGEPLRDQSAAALIKYSNNGELYGTGRINVPDEAYFVLGDNSGNSRDSRYWGFVPQKNLKGKAFLIYWPIRRIHLLRKHEFSNEDDDELMAAIKEYPEN